MHGRGSGCGRMDLLISMRGARCRVGLHGALGLRIRAGCCRFGGEEGTN